MLHIVKIYYTVPNVRFYLMACKIISVFPTLKIRSHFHYYVLYLLNNIIKYHESGEQVKHLLVLSHPYPLFLHPSKSATIYSPCYHHHYHFTHYYVIPRCPHVYQHLVPAIQPYQVLHTNATAFFRPIPSGITNHIW